MFKILSIFAMATLAAAQSYAHGIYFAERVQKTALVYGVGADDLQIVKRLPKIESFTAYNDNWEPVDAELKVADLMIFVDGKHAAVSAVMQNGIWSNTGEGHWIGKGPNVVAVTYDAPTDRPDIIDKYELLATLSFILPHIPE